MKEKYTRRQPKETEKTAPTAKQLLAGEAGRDPTPRVSDILSNSKKGKIFSSLDRYRGLFKKDSSEATHSDNRPTVSDAGKEPPQFPPPRSEATDFPEEPHFLLHKERLQQALRHSEPNSPKVQLLQLLIEKGIYESLREEASYKGETQSPEAIERANSLYREESKFKSNNKRQYDIVSHFFNEMQGNYQLAARDKRGVSYRSNNYDTSESMRLARAEAETEGTIMFLRHIENITHTDKLPPTSLDAEVEPSTAAQQKLTTILGGDPKASELGFEIMDLQIRAIS